MMGLRVNAVHRGDCLQRLAQLEAGSVDLVFADPPFNIGYKYDVYDDSRAADEYVEWSAGWIRGVHRCLKPNGSFWLAIGDEFAAELKLAAQREAGFHCRSWVIWYYTFGVNCARGFSRSHTHLLHFVKDPRDFTFNSDNPAVRVASARQLVYADARANPKGRLPDNTWIYRPQDAAPEGFAARHDTWYFARVAGTFHERQGFHGCQMPEQLLGRIIRVSSNPCDLVLDPFAGSGTTLAVARKLGRRWLGFELSGEYVRRIQARLKAARPGDPLTGPEDPLASAPATGKGRRRGRGRNGNGAASVDAAAEEGVLKAFRRVCEGFPPDYLLCQPERSLAFQRECRRLGVEGGPLVWNQQLLRLRKAGRLPAATQRVQGLGRRRTDPYGFASEIALRLLEIDYGWTLDQILCSPDAVRELDELAARFAPGWSPFEYRWAALHLRKRVHAARRLAAERFKDWRDHPLPPARRLSRPSLDGIPDQGVYVLQKDRETVYVGASLNVPDRLATIRESETWNSLGLTSFRVIPHPATSLQGLQCQLICRLEPLLNSALWRDGLTAAS